MRSRHSLGWTSASRSHGDGLRRALSRRADPRAPARLGPRCRDRARDRGGGRRDAVVATWRDPSNAGNLRRRADPSRARRGDAGDPPGGRPGPAGHPARHRGGGPAIPWAASPESPCARHGPRGARGGRRLRRPPRLGHSRRVVRAPDTYRIRVTIVDHPAVNAFAAPGGHIVVLRGLLERTRTPEELAGVLAHEIQHVYHRHPTRLVVQHTSAGLLAAAVAGDVSALMAYSLEAARI